MNINYLKHYTNESFDAIVNWGKKLGPVTYSILKKTSPPDPEWWIGSAKLANCPVGLFFTKNIAASAGTSIYPAEAAIKNIGETIERYSSLNSHLVDTFEPRVVDENMGFVRCAYFEDCEPSYKRGGIPNPIEHTLVENLLDGSSAYIPYEHVHLGFVRYNNKIMHTPPISTGCSFFYDQDTALWKSICEVVERDAMMRLWYLRLKACKVKIDGIVNEGLSIRKKRILDAGLQLHLFEISSIVDIPVFYAIIASDTFPYYCVGASCDADHIKAASKAIDEAISIRVMAKWNRYKDNQVYDFENFNWVNRLEKHMELYANWKNSDAFDFLLKNELPVKNITEIPAFKQWIKPPKNKEDFVTIAKQFKQKGFDIYWKDITVPEVREFGKVIKVVIPQMIPLSQGFNCRWLEPFTEVYEQGLLNPYPHPFS